MPYEFEENTFDQGMVDTMDEKKTPANTFDKGQNITLVKDGKWLSPTNLKGTTLVANLVDAGNWQVFNVMGAYSGYYLSNLGVRQKHITVFLGGLHNNGSYYQQIFYYNLETNKRVRFVEVAQTGTDANWVMSATVDCVVFGENGTDNYYFTDNHNPIRKIIGDYTKLPSSLLAPEELDILKDIPTSRIIPVSIDDAGTLINGSYQFALGLTDSSTGRGSGVTLFTNPIIVGNGIAKPSAWDNRSATGSEGGTAAKTISLNVSITPEDAAKYDYFQVYVIKNQSGIVPATKAFKVSQQPMNGSVSINFRYTGDVLETTVDINSVTVDLAAIKKVKTLAAKNNRLLAGQIEYYDLSVGDITIDNANTRPFTRAIGPPNSIASSSLSGGSADYENSFYKGYFRNEVYRYAVIYSDGHAWSKPKVIDFSATNTSKSLEGIDFKFPGREDSDVHQNLGNGYAIIDSNNNVRAMGLIISGIQGHPSWAKKMAIVRAKRKRNIIGQSPLIPAVVVEPALPIAWTATAGHYPDASGFLPDEDGTIMPKNLMHVAARSIRRVDAGEPYKSSVQIESGECDYKFENPVEYQVVHLPEISALGLGGETLFPYIHSPNDNIEIVDAILTKKVSRTYPPPQGLPTGSWGSPVYIRDYGDFKDTNRHDSFVVNGYYNYWHRFAGNNQPINEELNDILGAGVVPRVIPIREFMPIPSGQTAGVTTLKNNSSFPQNKFGDYDGMQGSMNDGVRPGNMKLVVLNLATGLDDPSRYASSSAGPENFPSKTNSPATIFQPYLKAGFNSQYIPLGRMDGSQGTNPNEVAGSTTDNMGCFYIVNVTKGLGDDRYGDAFAQNEFISTGAEYNLSESEVENDTPIEIEVWGGDCSLSTHHIKVNNSHYGVVDVVRDEGAVNEVQWGTLRTKTSGNKIKRPIPYKGLSQTISVILESEIIGSKLNNDEFEQQSSSTGGYIYTVQGAGGTRTAFDYAYNFGYSAQNEARVFFPPDRLDKNVTKYRSRIIYSDQKVYQSDVEGFDTFRVASTHDLDETNGGLTKLLRTGDLLYAIMEDGVYYVPVDSQDLELQDTETLAVRSGEVIGIPKLINDINGTRLIKSVRVLGDGFVYVDDQRHEIVLSGRTAKGGFSAEHLNTAKNELFSELLDPSLADYDMHTMYNPDTKQVTFVIPTSNGFENVVWNNELKSWESHIFLGDDRVHEGVFFNDRMYWICEGADGALRLDTTDTNDNLGNFIGTDRESYIEFNINPNHNFTKTFDVIGINSSDRLKSLDLSVEKDNGQPIQSVSGINIDVIPSETLYRATVPKDSNRARLRGQWAKCKIYWDNTKDDPASLKSVITKYRFSAPRM